MLYRKAVDSSYEVTGASKFIDWSQRYNKHNLIAALK